MGGPKVGKGSYVCSSATVIGDVTLGRNCFVLYGAVLRGDGSTSINIGNNTNIQDNAVLHGDPLYNCKVGNFVSIGHGAVVHGCTVGDSTIVGLNSTILNGAVIGRGCIIAAGAVVKENEVIPDHSLVVGVPGKVVRTAPSMEDRNKINAEHYCNLLIEHKKRKYKVFRSKL